MWGGIPCRPNSGEIEEIGRQIGNRDRHDLPLAVLRSNTTNENGEAAFTIVTKNKPGIARIRFLTGDISSESSVKVVK